MSIEKFERAEKFARRFEAIVRQVCSRQKLKGITLRVRDAVWRNIAEEEDVSITVWIDVFTVPRENRESSVRGYNQFSLVLALPESCSLSDKIDEEQVEIAMSELLGTYPCKVLPDE